MPHQIIFGNRLACRQKSIHHKLQVTLWEMVHVHTAFFYIKAGSIVLVVRPMSPPCPPPSEPPPPPPWPRKARFREPAFVLWHGQTLLRADRGESVRHLLLRVARLLGPEAGCLRHLAVAFRCHDGAACRNPGCLRGRTVLRAYDDEEGCDVRQLAVYLDAGALEAPFAPGLVAVEELATGEELLRLDGALPPRALFLALSRTLAKLGRPVPLPELRAFYDCGECGELPHVYRGRHCRLREGALPVVWVA
jgi:hypothetical protein